MRVDVAAGLMMLGSITPSADVETTAQRPAMPTLSSQGIARVAVLCLVVDPTVQRLPLQTRLCEMVRRIAAEGSPVPVKAIGFGDPVLLQTDTLGVLVHVAIDRSGARPIATLAVRPRRAGDMGALFGATPVAVLLAADGSIPEPALGAALNQVLPWRMRAAR